MKFFVASGEDRRLTPESRQALRGSFIELSDGVTHYELKGPEDGELVVMAGGLTIPLFYWDGLVTELHARGLRTLTCSAYGRGYSDRVRARYDEALFARQLAELTERLGLTTKPLHIVGTSMGAVVTMTYAAQYPSLVSTLTIVGPAGLAKPRPADPHRLLRNDLLAGVVARMRGRRILQGHLGHNVRDPELGTKLTDMVLEAFRFEGSLYAVFDTLQHLPLSGRDELFRQTGALGIPTLLLWGDEDNVTPLIHLSAARALLKPQEHHVIPRCGHMAPFERPRHVADQIVPFVAARAERLDS
ncbi:MULTISPECIES: alpha/beta fold hydrolase [Streptomyces]|uniref:4,5:9,10-diseco-3-hydroxy-5,9, 17-trioxoandrosta-1(10),2-diene-4-oate hydrolase n=1 Tax=Streptomyces chartreusis NRRL 3882 TaxID=1079985 RepID=A0A2N9BKG4_STRCX|nr:MULTISPECIES: alpha/beta hydrolase [Streptomyces]MYS94240.1 alpha/beta fold hydrolase [Streptomyces sp. SID5464]SOR83855.1 4,5:9,10-diseco-3-hydroxy-5,9, 17-trioxoandrosta-1(10),2-diene-4-oate hydrolase [Streptomyces chartreusis NRRL 3882]